MIAKGSALLTRELALQAVELVLPSIELAMSNGLVKRRHLHLIVMNPCIMYGQTSFEEAILCNYDFGKRTEWEYPFDQYARDKAHLSWRTSLPSHLIQQRRPHCYIAGHVKYGGSAIFEGIITGASGVQPYFDEIVRHVDRRGMLGTVYA